MSDDSMSLEEFAQTPEARQNAASWENIPHRGNRDGSVKMQANTDNSQLASNRPDDTLMTPDAMIETWRQLLAEGHRVIPGEGFFIIQGKEYGQVVRMHTDPLIAFDRTYRAFMEGQAGK